MLTSIPKPKLDLGFGSGYLYLADNRHWKLTVLIYILCCRAATDYFCCSFWCMSHTKVYVFAWPLSTIAILSWTELPVSRYQVRVLSVLDKTSWIIWSSWGLDKVWIQQQRNLSSIHVHYYSYSSDAASGWAGWALAHPEFGSSVNPIPTTLQIYTTRLRWNSSHS